MSKKTIGFLAVCVIVILMIWSSVSEPGINDLSVQFKEIDMIRNENNTGPVKRRYLVTVSDTIWEDFERYGNLMPYSKLGSTEVFFFKEDSPFPSQINLQGLPFDSGFDPYLVGRYSKNTMGQVSLNKFINKK